LFLRVLLYFYNENINEEIMKHPYVALKSPKSDFLASIVINNPETKYLLSFQQKQKVKNLLEILHIRRYQCLTNQQPYSERFLSAGLHRF